MIELKEAAFTFEKKLRKASLNSAEAKKLLASLEPIFKEIREGNQGSCGKRLRYDSLFIEGSLANENELADAYSRFANLLEGLRV